MKKIKFIQSNTIPDTFLAFTKGQLSYLRDKGLEIIAITSPGDKCEQFQQREQIKVYPVVMHRGISVLLDLVGLFQIILIMLKEQPDLVQGSTPKAGLLTMLAAAITLRPARLYFMRGLRYSRLEGWRRLVVCYMEKFTCLLAHRVLCISPQLMKEATENGIVSPEKTTVLHHGSSNGVDCNRFDPRRFDAGALRAQWNLSEEAMVLLFVGRIVNDKGIFELAECWKKLKAQYDNLFMIIAGKVENNDPPPQAVLDYLRAEDHVIMPGYVPDIVPLYAIADLVVVPTYREGFGNFNLEAAAMETPVVTTLVTGCMDAVVDGETGILVPSKDSEALAKAVSYLLDHPEVKKRMGKAGRERVIRDFRPQDVWGALHQEYVSLLIERGVIAQESEIMARAGEGDAEEIPGCDKFETHDKRAKQEAIQEAALENTKRGLNMRRSHGELLETLIRGGAPGHLFLGKRFQSLVKRGVDFTAAVILLVMLSPLLAFLAFLIRLTMGAPVLFRQRRPGLNESIFNLYKFRTMTYAKGPDGKLLPDKDRLTSLGRALRSTSLDELPQLINVLRGDMSLVGPRPLLVKYLGRYTPHHSRRHEVKPGITGWAQVNGRHSVKLSQRLDLDVWYVDNFSIWLDLKIIWMTFFAVLKRDDYREQQEHTLEIDDVGLTDAYYIANQGSKRNQSNNNQGDEP